MWLLLAAPENDIYFSFADCNREAYKCAHTPRTYIIFLLYLEKNVQIDEMSFNPHTHMAAYHLGHHDIWFNPLIK